MKTQTVFGMARFLSSVTTAIFFLLLRRGSAQGTLQFGFEEYQTGSLPPFVVFHGLGTQVTDSTTGQPFEGLKFLQGNGRLLIESPNGQLIEAYTVHLFMRTPFPGSFLNLSVGGRQVFVSAYESWQTVQGAFSSPVQSLEIVATYPGYEGISIPYGVDDLTFTTVPEPQTFWLLTLGLGAILLRRSKTLKTQSGMILRAFQFFCVLAGSAFGYYTKGIYSTRTNSITQQMTHNIIRKFTGNSTSQLP